MTLRFTLACSDPVNGDLSQLGASTSPQEIDERGERFDLDASASDAASVDTDAASASDAGAGDSAVSDASVSDAARATVRLYDTNAVAMYYDGTMGPYTGVIRVAYILADAALTLDFWHGHGGKQHRFTLLPSHYMELKRLRRVTVETSVVDGHTHTLFIDPVSPTYRVPGALPIDVPV